jgi:hypothetical protein
LRTKPGLGNLVANLAMTNKRTDHVGTGAWAHEIHVQALQIAIRLAVAAFPFTISHERKATTRTFG